MKKLDLNIVKNFYEKAESVWSSSSWYKHSYNYIDNYINNSEIVKSNYILNAGSAGNAYGLKCRMHHIDIAKNKIENCKEYTVGSIEKIPFDDCIFDGVLCVGSVINYTDAIISISELIRVTKSEGIIILEFENSNSFEYLFNKYYKSDAAIITTPYLDQFQRQWIYSYEYIMKIVESFKCIKVVDVKEFHILDALFANHENIAEKLNKFDDYFNKSNYMKKHSGNIIMTLKKL